MKCTSCKKMLVSEDNFTQFKCPSCMKETIIRCGSCRRKSNIYVCKKCKFEGP
ncbi:MAG: RNA-binding protein [Candidatus Aenigmarchaeota archaeon]|nr:RNA-binding protein [Candidatus Aenigmarchaeota archaeon]